MATLPITTLIPAAAQETANRGADAVRVPFTQIAVRLSSPGGRTVQHIELPS